MQEADAQACIEEHLAALVRRAGTGRTQAQGYDTAVPYFADVAAGIGETQEQRAAPRRYLQVPAGLLERDPGCYALRVSGDSMSPVLLDGDIVVVSPAAPLHGGCIVAAYVEPDGDVVKEYHELPGGGIELRPLNRAYSVLTLGGGSGREGRIWGRVVLQQREL
jgi:SOS-response transcriptional repressor LexA